MQVGDWVRIKQTPPWVARMPAETRGIFAHVVGKTYQVIGEEEQGWELDVGMEVDRLVGGFHNSVFVESEWLEADVPRFNLATAPNGFADVVHCGCGLTKALSLIGAQHCLDEHDPLHVGPSRISPDEHEEARSRFSAARQLRLFATEATPVPGGSAWFERLQEMSAGRPIVIWVGASLRERLWLWWLADGLCRLDVAGRDVWLVAPQDWWLETHAHLSAFGICNEAELAGLVPSAIPLASSTLQAFQTCWRWFCSGAGTYPDVPRPKDWTERWDWLCSAPPPFEFLLPKAGMLAWFDAELLSMLSTEAWRQPRGLVRQHETFQHFGPLMEHCGVWAIPDRMVALAQHPVPAVEMRRIDSGNALKACEFRLTEHGAQLLKTQRVQPGALPVLELGGFTHYS